MSKSKSSDPKIPLIDPLASAWLKGLSLGADKKPAAVAGKPGLKTSPLMVALPEMAPVGGCAWP